MQREMNLGIMTNGKLFNCGLKQPTITIGSIKRDGARGDWWIGDEAN